MDTGIVIEELDSILLYNPPVLFLGAGFSKGAKNTSDMFDGKELWNQIFDSLIKPRVEQDDYAEIETYSLRRLCQEVYSIYDGKKELEDFLTTIYKGVYPEKNSFHNKLISYPWKKIYTVNIDDLVENIYRSKHKDLFVQNKSKLMIEPDDKTILYKLHGCVNNPSNGYVFSESEYLELTTKKIDARLNAFASEMQHNNIIFVGASMDEPDIEYYLKIYEDAGCQYRKNKLIFVDPNPSRYLRNKVNKLDAILIKETTENFLNYVSKLNYRPEEIEKATINLEYSGVYQLKKLEKLYITPYESKIYAGNFCKWQDIADKWYTQMGIYNEAKKELDGLLLTEREVSCFSIYGAFFTGKSCLLKALAYYLSDKGYEVLEFRGRSLRKETVWDYIIKSKKKQFVLIIDGGSFYYELIEKMFSDGIQGKNIVILTASREYYHRKKRYYLEGNNYREFQIKDCFSRYDVEQIINKLDEKSNLFALASLNMKEKFSYVLKAKSMVNLIVGLTYGTGVRRVEDVYRRAIPKLSEREKMLLLELAIFDIADIELYPRELFTERYGGQLNIDCDTDIGKMQIVDFARMNEDGLSLRNSMLNTYIIKDKKNEIARVILDILKSVSRHVVEKNNDTWYIVFQCLLKEEVLEKNFGLDNEQRKVIYLSLKNNYSQISYYWLQMGLLYQKLGDYTSAYNFLEKSSSIRPNSYKIQHALARNFMRHANNSANKIDAVVLFNKGEVMIKKLIESKEYGKEKAKPFSVNCYVAEKIKFLSKFDINPTDSELKYLCHILETVANRNDSCMDRVLGVFYSYLESKSKLGLLHLTLDSPYTKFIGSKNKIIFDDIDDDVVIDAIN